MQYQNRNRIAGAIRRLAAAERRGPRWADELRTNRVIEYGHPVGTRGLR